MNECYYYLVFLCMCSSWPCALSSNNFEGDLSLSLPNVTITHVCEGEILFLKCSNSSEVIQIVRSMYGRTSQRICNPDFTHRFFEKTCANIGQSKSQTKLRCQGRSTCQMLIDNEVFTDPCGSNIPKHFEIHYRCIDQEQICSKLTHRCVKSNDLKCLKKIQDEFSCQCPPNICQYSNDQITGFVEHFCPEEHFQGLHWPKTTIQQGQSLSCPSPCTGEAVRFCHSTNQWSQPNYTNCHCPLKQSDQLSTYRSATSYVFQCNFWLINRIMPKADLCTLSFTNRNEDDHHDALNCLLSAFERMTFQFCSSDQSFGIDFQNVAFEIYVPRVNETQFQLLTNTPDSPVRIVVDRTLMITETSNTNLPMMAIDWKTSSSTNQSILLVEQENNLFSIQTANVTVIFQHQSSAFHYRCRGYHSKSVDSTNRFFACQLLCSNASHVICQCPFFNPFMHYVLDSDRLKTEEDFFDDADEHCSEKSNALNRINRYLDRSVSLNSAKKLLVLIDRLIPKEEVMNNAYDILQLIKRLSLQIIPLSNSFTSINNHLELVIKPNQFDIRNHNQSVVVSITPKENPRSDYRLIFFTVSNLNLNDTFNSDLIYLNVVPSNLSIDSIQIIFRHSNQTNQTPTCVHLKAHDVSHWSTDGCRLVSTNFTHSICSCKYFSTFALLMESPKPKTKSNNHGLSHIPKIGCIISIICLLLTLSTLIIRRSHMDINDDLTIVRNILHINMLLCLIIVQILFLFGLELIKYKFVCRMISILLDYFLLASFSWMFVDGMELLIALKHGFQIDRIRLIAYSLYSYGFPLLIVFLSIALSTKNEISSSKYCWLSHDNTCMWTFAIPFILLIMANLCFFAVAIYSICRRLNPSEENNRIRFSLRDISTISILYGLTWIIALFYLYDQNMLFAYVFTVLNSIHACLIFTFYCILQKHIRHSFVKLPFYHFFQRTNENHAHPNRKSLEHYSVPDNTSSSGYSSGHSSDVNNKQILCPSKQDYNANHYDRRSCLNPETPYLPSIPINLLTNRLSTFRYPMPSNEMILSYEQKEQLLRKNPMHEDDHQYYEIG